MNFSNFNWQQVELTNGICINKQLTLNCHSYSFFPDGVYCHFQEFPHNYFLNRELFFRMPQNQKETGPLIDSIVSGHEILGYCDYNAWWVLTSLFKLLWNLQVCIKDLIGLLLDTIAVLRKQLGKKEEILIVNDLKCTENKFPGNNNY